MAVCYSKIRHQFGRRAGTFIRRRWLWDGFEPPESARVEDVWSDGSRSVTKRSWRLTAAPLAPAGISAQLTLGWLRGQRTKVAGHGWPCLPGSG